MRFVLYTAPKGEPVTVADVVGQSQLGTIADDQTPTVLAYIDAATAYCERRLRRQLMPATWRMYLDEFPAEITIADHLPVTAISSITYTDDTGVAQTLSTAT